MIASANDAVVQKLPLLRRLATATLIAVNTITASMAQTPATAPIGQPDFGPNVMIFDPSMADIQAKLDAVYATQEAGQFNDHRFAILFWPGEYNLDVQVGFYTQVAGLGQSPDDIHITGAVRSKAKWMRNNNATCNFWRAVENLSVTPTLDSNVNVWAVSQATAMRRVHVKGDLHLWDGGWSSGGFLADCVIDGAVVSGSQQQWLSRNADWGGWKGGSWNMVFVGTTNPPPGEWPEKPYTVVDKTPVVREKPYLFVDKAGQYFVNVPRFEPAGTRGVTWKNGPTPATAISIDQFFIARSERDSATTINAALDAGKHVLLTPGIYHLDAPLRVTKPNTIVLGLGYPTLVADKGNTLIELADVDGLQLGGVLLEAGEVNSPTLLQVGEPGSARSHAVNPTFLFDIFARAGGAAPGSADCFVTINSGNIVGDNFWLWRADHGKGAGWTTNPNRNGLIVNGPDVTIYGLFVEHTQEYQTLWNANGGRVYFYQSELPYDPPTQAAWMNGDQRGYASYKVADTVTTHEAWGLGVYSVFHQSPMILDSAIEAPRVDGVRFHHMITRRLNRPGSGIAHILNDGGEPVIENDTARLK